MDDFWATLSRIAADRESGSAQIARRAAEALGDVPHSHVRSAIRFLLLAHPSMAPLWRLATDLLNAQDPATGVNDFLRRLESDEAAASTLAPELPKSVLTISFSSSVLMAIRDASVESLICMRSEPGGEGERMAEAARPIRARVIEDDEALDLVPAEAVVVGADAITPSASINKVKTRALAEAARREAVPCYAVAGETKFVGVELPLAAPFESVPIELLTAVATPAGLLSPVLAGQVASRASLHPELQPLLRELSRS